MNLILTFFLSSLATLVIVHSVALKFFLYWKYAWLDVPVHVLGGISVALGIMSLQFLGLKLPKFFETRWGFVSMAIIVGTAWEIFEYSAGVVTVDEYLIPDTLLDYSMNVAGVLVGYGIVRSIKTLE